MKGMILDILRPADGHDLTLRGLSIRATRAYLIGDRLISRRERLKK